MKRKVLVVDDVPAEAEELVAHLEQGGYNVLYASSGVQAVEILETEPLDVVLCDLEMPEMSGQAVLDAVGRNPKIRCLPFILINHEWTWENWSRPTSTGRTADTHLPKPVSLREVSVFLKWIFQNLDPDRHASETC